MEKTDAIKIFNIREEVQRSTANYPNTALNILQERLIKGAAEQAIKKAREEEAKKAETK